MGLGRIELEGIMPYLICLEGDNAEKEWVVGTDTTIIGRDRENAVLLHDTRSSRKHCKIYQRNNVYFLEDLGSQNGTLIQNKPIKGATLLELDTVFQVGGSVLYFSRFSLGELLTKQFTEAGSAYDRVDAFNRLRAHILAGKTSQKQGGIAKKIGHLFGGSKKKVARSWQAPPSEKHVI